MTLDRRCRRRSGARSCAGRAPARSTRLARELRPDAIIERYYNFGGEGDPRRPRRLARSTVLEVNAPVIDHAGSAKALARPRAARRSRCGAGASASARLADAHRHAERGDPAAGHAAAQRFVELEWGADTERFRPGRRRAAAVPPAGAARSRCSPARSAAGTARCTWSTRSGSLRARGRHGHSARLRRRRPGAAARARGGGVGLEHVVFTGALPHDGMPACLAGRRHRRRAVRHRRARAAGAGLLLVAAEDLRVHGGGPAGGRARPATAFRRWSATSARRCSTIRARTRRRSPTRWRALTDAALRARLGRRGAERAVRDYSWAAHCRALDARACAGRAGGQRAMNDPASHRRVSAGLRRQRLEHLRAGARAARARPRRARRAAAARDAPDVARASPTTASASSSSARRRRTCPTCATTSRTSGCTRRWRDYLDVAHRTRAHRHRPRRST